MSVIGAALVLSAGAHSYGGGTEAPGYKAADEETLEHFTRLDDDCNLQITREEAADWKPLEVNFAKADVDGSETIELREFFGIQRVVDQMTKSGTQ